jgi:thioredoxin-related protein
MKTLGHEVAALLLVASLLLLPLCLAGQTSAAKSANVSDLIAAVKAKDGAHVSSLLRSGADPNGKDANGMTPLHYASSAGDLTAVVLLVAAGANVNAKDGAGQTPLHDAAVCGSREVADILLATGADARATSTGGLTPADVASRNHHQALADFLHSREASPAASQGSGKAHTYTNDDLEAVRRRNRLANEEQLAQAKSGAPVATAPSESLPESSLATPDYGKSTLPMETKNQLKRAFDQGSWTDNIEAAQQFSRETRRPILALFTGSDWCHFCQQLEAKVLSTSAFREAVSGKYILLYLDFPRKKTVPKDVLAQRTRLAQKYGVRGYPTLVVLINGDQYLDRISGFKSGMTTEKYISQIEDIAR